MEELPKCLTRRCTIGLTDQTRRDAGCRQDCQEQVRTETHGRNRNVMTNALRNPITPGSTFHAFAPTTSDSFHKCRLDLQLVEIGPEVI